jgi:hypothetical protein
MSLSCWGRSGETTHLSATVSMPKLKSDSGGDHCATSSGDSGDDSRRRTRTLASRNARLVSLLTCHFQDFVGAFAVGIDADAL